jgi:hypothetical protein
VAVGLAGAALLLAFLFHLGVAAVAVAILATVPALYLAWKALPTRKPSRGGRPARQWDPVDLGVHRVTGGGPLPPYIHRRHDELLAAVLDPAVRASRLVVLRGGSSTGKSRAAYHAVTGQLADWRLDYPQDPATLTTRLEAGIPARTVLWLADLRQYADVDGGPAALAKLADLLDGEGQIVVTTVWPEHWEKYTAAAEGARGPADPAGVAGRLLQRLPDLTTTHRAAIDPARGGVIDVPPKFTGEDLDAATNTGDPVLAEAAAAAAGAGQDGQVTQYLAAVPDLLKRYAGEGGDPYGQAVITAAVDAARLGHASLLPAALLQYAAVDYLTDEQRTKPLATWGETALEWATAELKGAIRALQPVPPPSGTGVAGYRVADYLDQHSRRIRQDKLGKPSLWDALVAYTTSPTDLDRLGRTARDRGLYRYAAALWTKGATLDSVEAASALIYLLHEFSSEDITSAADWAADQVSLDDPGSGSWLLEALRQAGAEGAAQALAERAAVCVSLGDPAAVAVLLQGLRMAKAEDAVQALLVRDLAAHVSLDDPYGVSRLLEALRWAGAEGAAQALAERAAAHASPDKPGDTAILLRGLRAGGAEAAVRALAERAVDQASLDNPDGVSLLLHVLNEVGADGAVRALAERAAAQASLDNPEDVAALLGKLREARADGAARILLARDPANQVSLNRLGGVSLLLKELREVGADGAAWALANRAAAHVSLDNPGDVIELLFGLREVGADGAIPSLAERAAEEVSVDDLKGVAVLLATLRQEGAEDAHQTLAERAAVRASLGNPYDTSWLLMELREAGADGTIQILLARDPGAQADVNDPNRVAWLLRTLCEVGADGAVWALANRAAAHVSLDNPSHTAILLRELRAAGADDAARALVARVLQANIDDPGGVASLLEELRAAGADDTTRALAGRAAAHAGLNEVGVRKLLEELHAVGVEDARRVLAGRAANAGMFRLALDVYADEATRYRHGREPDGTPSQPWRWQEFGGLNTGSAERQDPLPIRSQNRTQSN